MTRPISVKELKHFYLILFTKNQQYLNAKIKKKLDNKQSLIIQNKPINKTRILVIFKFEFYKLLKIIF